MTEYSEENTQEKLEDGEIPLRRMRDVIRIKGGEEWLMYKHFAAMRLDKNKKIIPHGLPRLANAAKDFLWHGFDFIVVIIGTEGKGKSRTGVKYGQEVKVRMKEVFDLERDIIFNNRTVEEVDKLMRETRRGVMEFDEGAHWFYKRDSMTKSVKDLLKTTTDTRANCNCLIICISDVGDIDKYFRERRARVVLLHLDRGYFALLVSKNTGVATQDNFGLEAYAKILGRSDPLNFYEKRRAIFNLNTCVGFIEIPDLDPETGGRYDYLKAKYNIAKRQNLNDPYAFIIRPDVVETLRVLEEKSEGEVQCPDCGIMVKDKITFAMIGKAMNLPPGIVEGEVMKLKRIKIKDVQPETKKETFDREFAFVFGE